MLKELDYERNGKQIMTWFPLINAVLNGLQDGLIFSNDDDQLPLYIIHKSGFSFLTNKEEVYIPAVFDLMITLDKIPTYIQVYDASKRLISYCGERNEIVNIKVRKRLQLQYEGSANNFDWISHPVNYCIERIDRYNFSKVSVFNLELDKRFWRSEEDFIQNGFGYCLFNEVKLPVSICYSACIANEKVEIDVATLQEFRNRGFAKCVVSSFVKHCIENKIIANWDCFENNYGSLTIAKKMGFKEVNRYDLLSIFNKTKAYE
jgi:RimJ/RimL family protein N-acetyltransferase